MEENFITNNSCSCRLRTFKMLDFKNYGDNLTAESHSKDADLLP